MYYRFLGVELVGLIEGWIEEEKQSVLNIEPPPSPPYLEAENVGTTVSIAPPSEAPDQAPPVGVEEEVVASNPPPTIDEPTSGANEAMFGFMGGATLINLEEEERTTITNNDHPSA